MEAPHLDLQVSVMDGVPAAPVVTGAGGSQGYGAPTNEGYGPSSAVSPFEDSAASSGYGAPAPSAPSGSASSGHGAPTNEGYGPSSAVSPFEDSAASSGY